MRENGGEGGRDMKHLRRALRVLLAVALAAALGYAALRGRGLLLWPDQVDPRPWEVWGVDVSSYQGEVDWGLLRRQGVDFAFIKATEGSGLTDSRFSANWAGAREAGVLAGAYHFFSYDSPGAGQAARFCSVVPVQAGSLPPVVDIEFYGPYLEQPKDPEEVWPILDELLAALEAHYGCKPILYVTERSYRLYVEDRYPDCPLWVSMPVAAPVWRNWTFWQYSHTGELAGYTGAQRYIDMNVFRGTREELEALCIKV